MAPLCAVLLTCATSAVPVTLIDRNAQAEFNFDGSPGVIGMRDWIVEGQDQLQQQWFWYRVGAAGPEQPIDSISAPVVVASNLNVNPGNERVKVTYTAATIKVEVTYVLSGGLTGSGASALTKTIRITNPSAATRSYRFIEYVDFDLMNALPDDVVQITGGNTATQSDPTLSVTQTVTTPAPATYAGTLVGGLGDILSLLSDALPNDLVIAPGPLGGNAAWGFQWNFSLAPGNSFLISDIKSLTLVPEPATLVALVTALAVAAGRRRSRI